LRKLADMDVPLRLRFASNPGGVSHEFHRQRFLVEGDSPDRRYLPATLSDNPSLDAVEYLKNLQHLDPLTRQRLLAGDWDALPEGGMFRREWFHVVEPHQLPDDLRWVRFWDRASTAPEQGKDPDYTAGALVGFRKGIWYIKNIVRFRDTPQGNERRIREVALADGKRVAIWMEQEPGSSGADVISHYARHVLAGFAFKGRRSTGSKAERAGPVASAAELGNVRLCSGPWVSDFLDEATGFPMTPHDDMIDALSGAFACLSSGSGRIFTFRVHGL
jgi:predicted phage terminase large subunit-like protein